MSARPLRVLVATPLGRGGNGGIDRLMDGLRDQLAREPIPGVSVTFGVTRGQGSIYRSPLVLAAFLLRMLWLRAIGRVDLVHVNLSFRGSTYRKLVLIALARALRLPYVVHLHAGNYVVYTRDAPPWLKRRIISIFSGAQRAVVLGEVWRKFVLSVSPDARPVVLLNATRQPERARKGLGAETKLLFLGRLGGPKGVPELLSALQKLAPLPGWRATLAGDGQIDEARQFVAASGLQDHVSVPGWTGPDEVDALLSDADVLILPSHGENLPMSVVEGMGAGLAVIATPVGAVPEIIEDGVTGLLVPVGDAEQLAVAMRRLIEDPALRARLGEAARAFHREHLEIGGYARRLAAIWRDSVSTSGA